MEVTIGPKDKNKVANLVKAIKKAKYDELYGEELASLSLCMFWLFDLNDKLGMPEPTKSAAKIIKKPRKKNGNKSKSRQI